MKEKQEAVGLIKFALELCEIQRRAGRHYIFEQPLSARSWQLACVQDFILKPSGNTQFDKVTAASINYISLSLSSLYMELIYIN